MILQYLRIGNFSSDRFFSHFLKFNGFLTISLNYYDFSQHFFQIEHIFISFLNLDGVFRYFLKFYDFGSFRGFLGAFFNANGFSLQFYSIQWFFPTEKDESVVLT